MSTRQQLDEQIAQARLDLAEVTEQLAAGELDEATALRLRRRYEAEIEDASQQQPAAPGEGPPSRRRLAIGIAFMAAAIAGIVFLAVQAIDDRRPGDFVTGNIEGRDLSEVSTAEMEAVVADFPNVVGMRLALARRYFESGDLSTALPHYLAVLEQDPSNPEANANLGWMTFVSDPGQAATAAAFVERALSTAPGYAQATFYLANIRLYGLEDPAGARPLVDELLRMDDLPPDVTATLAVMAQDLEDGS